MNQLNKKILPPVRAACERSQERESHNGTSVPDSIDSNCSSDSKGILVAEIVSRGDFNGISFSS